MFDYDERIESILKELTLEEKIAMIHGNGLFKTEGVERLNIPPLKMSDGPMGVRNEFENAEWKCVGLTDDYVTYMPSNSAIASTWSKELAYSAGNVLGSEARGRGKDVILAPGINIKRSPLCGRNFEYMSEDPEVICELAPKIIEGIQENDVACCVKHFAFNNQETERLWVDVDVDERAKREIYLKGFKAAVEEGNAYSVMSAYNMYKGVHCSQNNLLLKDILRDEWNYDGTIISDWGAVHDTKLAAESELDIEMSVTYNFDEYYFANPLIEKIKSGEISEECVDQKIRNILRMMIRLNMLDDSIKRKPGEYNSSKNREAVLDVARESIILLKNEDKKLPLSKDVKKVAVIGKNGEMIHSNGGGSAEIKALYEISPLMGIKKLLGGNTEVTYADGYYIPSKSDKSEDTNWQEKSLMEHEESKAAEDEKHEKESLSYLEKALEIAKEADEVIVIGGLNHDFDVEGFDKSDIKLPYKQDRLIEEILKVKEDAIIVIEAGAPVEMPWADKAKSIIYMYYSGMEGGTALAETIFGDVNPSGKLAETFPVSLKDSPEQVFGQFPGETTVKYNEGIFVGYRYYDTYNVQPRFCFGHGLSYTTFDYRAMEVKKYKDDKIKVVVDVANTGDKTGKEVVQIYVQKEDSSVKRPVKELRAFEKVELKPGECAHITFILEKDDFTYYDTEKAEFVCEQGKYTIHAAASSQDIRLSKCINI